MSGNKNYHRKFGSDEMESWFTDSTNTVSNIYTKWHQPWIVETAASLSTTSHCDKNLRSGVYKSTTNRSRPLTYEQAQKPHLIGQRKSWNSWNTSNLVDEIENCSETTVEDIFIRKFINGTWHGLLASELIIKRRQNLIVLAGLIFQNVAPSKMYFLQGYTEELLARLLRRPVRMEIQTVNNRKDVLFKWI